MSPPMCHVTDMATKWRGSEHERRGWGAGWDAVDRAGSECHHLRAVGGGGPHWKTRCIVVVDDIDNIDGGCAGSDGGDVTTLGGVLGCSTKVCMAVLAVSGVAWELKSTWGISAFFAEVSCSLSGVGVTWVVASTMVGAAGVTWMSTSTVVVASVWALASSSKTALQDSALAWAAIERQSPVPCPSMSHFCHSLSFPCCIPSSYPSSCPSLHALSSFSLSSFPFMS